MKLKHFDSAVQAVFLALIYLSAVIFDRRIGIVFSNTKAAEIRVFTIIILSIWAIKLLIFKDRKFVRTPLDWPVLTYLLSCTIATLTSVHVYTSFFGFYGRFEGLITLYNFGLLFFIAANYLKDSGFIKSLIATICSAGVLMSIYGIIQRKGVDPYQWGGVSTWERVIGTTGQPNFFAAYLDMAFLLALILFLLPKKSPNNTGIKNFFPLFYFLFSILVFILMIYNLGTREVFLWYGGFIACAAFAVGFSFYQDDLPPLIHETIYGVSLILTYTALFFTQSRGGFMGFFSALSLFFILAPKKLLIENWQKILILFVALGFVTGMTVLDPQFSLFNRMAGEIKIENIPAKSATKIEFEGAAGSRGETWKSAFNIIGDHPFFGIGPEAMKMVFPRYETDLFRFKEAFHVKQDRCHNETLDVPVTRGLCSFFFYVLLLGILYRQGIAGLKRSSEGTKLIISGFLAAVTAYLVQNQFSFGVVSITSIFWIMWAVVVGAADLPEKSDTDNSKKASVGDIPWLYAALIAVIAGGLIYGSLFQYRADLEFKMAKTLAEVGRHEDALYYYDRAIAILPFESGPITHKSLSLLNFANRAAPEVKEKVNADTINLLKYGTLVDPLNADNFYILSRIYLLQDNPAEAMLNARKALLIDPYYAEEYIVLAQLAEKQKDRAKALQYFKEAYRINPTIPEVKIKIIWEKIESGRLDEAYDLAEEILLENPRYIEAHNVLGTIYLKKNEPARAKQEFETVLYLDPENSYAKTMLK